MLNRFKPFQYSVVSSIKQILTSQKKNFTSSLKSCGIQEVLSGTSLCWTKSCWIMSDFAFVRLIWSIVPADLRHADRSMFSLDCGSHQLTNCCTASGSDVSMPNMSLLTAFGSCKALYSHAGRTNEVSDALMHCATSAGTRSQGTRLFARSTDNRECKLKAAGDWWEMMCDNLQLGRQIHIIGTKPRCSLLPVDYG